MLKEFREFALRGSVVDLAVGIIIGTAFGTIVNSLVNDILMPPIGLLLGKVDFSNLFVTLQTGDPLIYPRKETKDYGTRRAIEGTFAPGERAVVLDDLISSGGSKIEAIAPLAAAGLAVEDVVVLIDRESGGREELARQGYRLHAVLTLRQILDVLAAGGEVDAQQRATVLDWLAGA